MKFSVAAATTALAASVSASSPNCVCCDSLAKESSLKGKVLAKGTPEYEARLQDYYSANAAQPAWCMVMPETTEDVQAVASILTKKDCPFGIRAGAHSAFKGSNGIKNGVTVDFGHLNTTTYDEDSKVVSIQPGSTWGPVYETLSPHDVTVAGARTSVVGVGGFTTGAGYTFHSNEHGFSCDNVVNWEIVLANGTVVNANEKENSDLYKAQKGGSGNLGFVTRIDMATIAGTQLWGGFTSYNLTERDAVFNAYLNFVENTPEDSPNQNIIAVYYDQTGFSLRSILTNTDGVANASAFNEYLAIPNIGSTLASGPESEIIPQFTGPTPLGLYANWFTGMATNSFEALAAIDDLHHEWVPQMKAAAPNATFSTLVELQPVQKQMTEHAQKRGGNILGLESIVEDGPTLMWLVSLTVDTEENQAKILPVCQKFIAAINQKQKEQDTFVDWVYLNYAWLDQKPYLHYGQDNIDLLHAVSAKYDPNGAFQNLRQTGFKLPVNGEEHNA